MKQLTTKINKGEVTSLCADAISELERAVRLFPEWPSIIDSRVPEHYTYVLKFLREQNEEKVSYAPVCAASIFCEEWFEFLEAAIKPGNRVAARIELVQAMAMLIRISCHLNDYVPLTAEQEPRVNPEEAASQGETSSELNRHEVRPRLGFEKGVTP